MADIFKIIGSVFLESDQFDSTVNHVEKKSSTLGDTLGKIGGGVVKAGAAVGTAATAAFAGLSVMVGKSVEAADETQKMADMYGMSAERVQELSYAGKKLDVDLETILKSQSKLTKAMFEAKDGTGAQADAFKRLGISVTDSNGNLRDSKEVMAEAFEALKNTGNETERDALAMKLFGKSAMELNPMIKAGGEELARLSEEARKTGAVITDEGVAALDKFGDNMSALGESAKGLAGSLAVQLMPQMNALTDFAKGLAETLADAVKTGNFDKFGDVLAEGVTGAVDNIANGIAKFMPVFIKVLNTLIRALVQAIPIILPALIDGVLQFLNAFITILAENGPMLIDAAMNMILTLATGLLNALPKLVPVAIDLIIKFTLALYDMLPKLIPVAIQAIIQIAEGLIDALPKLIEAVPQIVKSIIKGIVDNLPMLIDATIKIIMAIVDFLLEPDNIVMLIKAAVQIVVAIVGGLIQAIPQLIDGVGQLITKMASAFMNFDWWGLGKSILSSITGALGDFWNWITGNKSVKVDVSGGPPHIPGMADGGDVIKSGLSWVGEQGPELLNLPRGAQVTPLGRGGLTININKPQVFKLSDVDDLMDAVTKRAKQLLGGALA